jgi:hypothetical protein
MVAGPFLDLSHNGCRLEMRYSSTESFLTTKSAIPWPRVKMTRQDSLPYRTGLLESRGRDEIRETGFLHCPFKRY